MKEIKNAKAILLGLLVLAATLVFTTISGNSDSYHADRLWLASNTVFTANERTIADLGHRKQIKEVTMAKFRILDKKSDRTYIWLNKYSAIYAKVDGHDLIRSTYHLPGFEMFGMITTPPTHKGEGLVEWYTERNWPQILSVSILFGAFAGIGYHSLEVRRRIPAIERVRTSQ